VVGGQIEKEDDITVIGENAFVPSDAEIGRGVMLEGKQL
jgi:hypothetical protein